MSNKCKSCASCGMPLEKKEHFFNADFNSIYCSYCVDKNGVLLEFNEILRATAGYLSESQGIPSNNAEKMAKDLLLKQPAWKNHKA